MKIFMVLFLFSGLLPAQNPEVKKAGGPIIDSLELNEAYTYEEGIWKVENASSGVGPDEIQVRIEGITDEEYQALGLEEKAGIGFVTADGKKWPTGQYESSHKLENLLILRARRVKIDSFKALLQLHRAGYKIPKIDSNQPEGK